MPKPEQISFRCPECDSVTRDTVLGGASSVVVCEKCAGVTQRSGLVAGPDGVLGLRPEPPDEEWSGTFIAVYPDGSRAPVDLEGHVLRPGGKLPGSRLALERWDVTDEPVEEGRFEIVGLLTEKND